MNAAVIERLQQAFDQESTLGGPRGAALLRILAGMAELRSRETYWLDDYAAFQAVRTDWLRLLAQYAPPEPSDISRRIQKGRRALELIERDDLASDERARSLSLISTLAADASLPWEIRSEFLRAAATPQD